MLLMWREVVFMIHIVTDSTAQLTGCKLIPETTFKRGYNE